MASYEARLDRIEAVIAQEDALLVLLVRDGETEEQALAAYAKSHRLTVAQLGGTVFISEVDARL